MSSKGYNFHSYSKETYQFLYLLHKKGTISDKNYIKFGECKSFNQILNLTQEQFSITENIFSKIREYVWNSWNWKRGKIKDSVIFNEWQSIFMRELLKKNGIMTREECLNELLTDQQISSHVVALEEMNYLKSIKTSRLASSKTIYLINPDIVIECQK